MDTHWQDALPKPVAFVFSGGAALGAIQVGMLKALERVGLEPDLVVGTSVGALNGAIIADYGLAEGVEMLDRLWRMLKTADAFPGGYLRQLTHFASNRTSVYSNRGLRTIIKKHLNALDFEDLLLPFGALATNLLTNHGALFRSGDLTSALLASAAIPGVYPPVKIGEQQYVDGALVANLPLRFALEMGAKSIVALDAGEMCHREMAPTSIVEMFTSSLTAVLRQRSRIEAPQIAAQVPLLYLPTPCSLNNDLTDFSHSVPMMNAAESLSNLFLAEMPVPSVGKMCGAPHFHGEEPLYTLTELL